jgi:tetratricopeptide (TPR) repeat protein
MTVTNVPAMSTHSDPITLCMIVKDEAPVIAWCLESVRNQVTGWVVVDTGSSDDTRTIIKKTMAGIPGLLVERPWVNFGHNRTEAMHLAKEFASERGYILVIDADDELHIPDAFAWPPLVADGYKLRHHYESGIGFPRAQLFRADLPWEYVGVVHEYAQLADGEAVLADLQDPWVLIGQDGARRRRDPVEQRLADAALLEEAVRKDPSDARSLFYLAQSYKDAGEHQKAFDRYCQRAELCGWPEETWYALYQAARIAVALERQEDAITLLKRAIALRPQRMEAFVELAKLYRIREEWDLARLHAGCAAAYDRVPKSETLLVDPCHYGGWRALDEWSLAVYYFGNKDLAADLFQRMLDDPTLPESERPRIRQHLDFATPKKYGAPYLVETPAQESLRRLCVSYTADISTAVMAMSTETATFLASLIKHERVKSALDLGSGFSSGVLRMTMDGAVTAVDTDSVWLEKTRSFLKRIDPHGDPDLQLWDHFVQSDRRCRDLVVLDMARTEVRAQYLPEAWARVAPGGFLFVDDMHHVPFRDDVLAFFSGRPHTPIDVQKQTLDSYDRFGWLIGKPKPSTGGHTPQRVVIGLGTGRCGSSSLAFLLDKQTGASVTHESKPLKWDATAAEVRAQINTLRDRPYPLVGDVGPYYLPHVEKLLDDPSIVFVGMRRDKEATVRSLQAWTRGKDHWRAQEKPDPWDSCFPMIEAPTKAEAIEAYWDQYYDTLERLQERFPDRVRIFDMGHLNDADAIRSLLLFTGIEDPNVLVGVRRNTAKARGISWDT